MSRFGKQVKIQINFLTLKIFRLARFVIILIINITQRFIHIDF